MSQPEGVGNDRYFTSAKTEQTSLGKQAHENENSFEPPVHGHACSRFWVNEEISQLSAATRIDILM